MTAREPERWGSYVLEERIASGGMAEVFRARRMGAAAFSRQVCVKRLHAHLSSDPGFVEMFLDEARTGAKLRHRNIVAVDDLGEHEGRYFIAMEFVRGVDLAVLEARALAAGVRVAPDVGVFVAIEVLAALHAAHRAIDPDTGTPLHVVHRDVAPHNVMVSFGAEVKLGDFGIARAAGRRHVTQGEVARGRFGYMPLEQAGGRGVDARTDLFALGVVLYELLAGRRPFRGDNPDATLADIIAAQVINDRPPLASLRADLPDALCALIEQMLSPQPDGRPADAHTALVALSGLREAVTGGASLAALITHLFPGQSSSAAVPALGIATAPSVVPAARAAVDPYAATPALAAETDPGAALPLAGVASTLPRAPVVRTLPGARGYLAVLAGLALGGGVVAFTLAHRAAPSASPSRVAPTDASTPALVVSTPIVLAPVAPVAPVALVPVPAPRAASVHHDHATHVAVVAPVAPPVVAPPVAPPVVTAPPPEARLRVVVGSATGTIFVDGRQVGVLTSETRVEAGVAHTVHVDGDQPFTRQVRVAAGHRVLVRSDDEGHVSERELAP